MTAFNKIQQPLIFTLGEKSVLWIPGINKYMVGQPLTSEIILQFFNEKPDRLIVEYIKHKTGCSKVRAEKLVQDIKKIWETESLLPAEKKQVDDNIQITNDDRKLYSTRFYSINNIIFSAEYESADAEWYNHPKFAHLEIPQTKNPNHLFRVCDSNNVLTLLVNHEHCGSWPKAQNHYLSGKFSMKIIQKIYNNDEKDWMGIFHAAGISNGKECLLFFGDSGNGKSTLSALAMANGFDVLSDDFLPVESETALVFRFPSALSIKKQAYDVVTSLYPEFIYSKEFENPSFQKTYRYLPPGKLDLEGVPCRAIIKVTYNPAISFQMEEIPPEEAFMQLVPDSWIYPSKENAFRFLTWFSGLKCYTLNYSDNTKMINSIRDLFGD